MAVTTVNWDSDEWETINDDGFVYQRKKRDAGPTSSVPAPDSEPDPAREHKRKLMRRRTALLQAKGKYQRELALWDNLASTFKEMDDRVKSKLQQKGSEVQPHGPCNRVSQSSGLLEKNYQSLIHELLLKVEAQEAIIDKYEELCDVVDMYCDVQEENTKQDFFNLPIWKSPRELIASLCDD